MPSPPASTSTWTQHEQAVYLSCAVIGAFVAGVVVSIVIFACCYWQRCACFKHHRQNARRRRGSNNNSTNNSHSLRDDFVSSSPPLKLHRGELSMHSQTGSHKSVASNHDTAMDNTSDQGISDDDRNLENHNNVSRAPYAARISYTDKNNKNYIEDNEKLKDAKSNNFPDVDLLPWPPASLSSASSATHIVPELHEDMLDMIGKGKPKHEKYNTEESFAVHEKIMESMAFQTTLEVVGQMHGVDDIADDDDGLQLKRTSKTSLYDDPLQSHAHMLLTPCASNNTSDNSIDCSDLKIPYSSRHALTATKRWSYCDNEQLGVEADSRITADIGNDSSDEGESDDVGTDDYHQGNNHKADTSSDISDDDQTVPRGMTKKTLGSRKSLICKSMSLSDQTFSSPSSSSSSSLAMPSPRSVRRKASPPSPQSQKNSLSSHTTTHHYQNKNFAILSASSGSLTKLRSDIRKGQGLGSNSDLVLVSRATGQRGGDGDVMYASNPTLPTQIADDNNNNRSIAHFELRRGISLPLDDIAEAS